MYPQLQSAFAEVYNLLALLDLLSLLILLAGVGLLYRSFQEKFMLPWIMGWIFYTFAKLLLAASAPQTTLNLLGVAFFVIAAGSFGAAVLQYCGRSPFSAMTGGAVLLALLLGGIDSLYSSAALRGAFFLAWHVPLWIAAFHLALYSRGRRAPGLWLLLLSLLLLHLDRSLPRHSLLGYAVPGDLMVDVMLGISMMMVVLDDSRAKIERLDALHRIDRVISDSDEFYPIVDAALDELMRISGAPSAWFRILKEGKLYIVVQRGLEESAAARLREIDDATSTSGQVLRAGGVAIVRVEEIPPEFQGPLKDQGLQHLVLIPVLGKSSRIGILLLGQRRYRTYGEDERKFLKSAANQLGLAAENRQLVEQLVHSQSEWASTFNSIRDYVLVHDAQFRILRANQALLDRLQMPFTRVVLQPCAAVLPPGSGDWSLCPYCETPSRPADHDPCFGGYSVVSSSAYSGQDSTGGTVHVIKDITGEKIAEERYKILFDHMQEGVFVSSPEGRLLDCNDAFLSMLGYSDKEEILRLDAAASLYADPDDRRKFLAEMAEHGFVRNFEYVLRRKDGRHITVVESSFATRGPNGEIERYQGVVLDVTDKKMAEDKVRRRNRELHMLNNIAVTFNQSFNLDEILQISMLQIIDLFSTDTAAVFVFEEETGSMHRKAGYGHRSSWVMENETFVLPADFLQAIQKGRLEILTHHDLPQMPEVVKKYVELEGLRSWLWVMLWRKDKVLGMLGTSSRSQREFSPEETRVVLAVGGQLATTIDKIQLYEETRKAYDDLRRTQEQLLQSEKMSAVGQMISGVAHELNNPLTAILGYAQLLETEEIQPRVREYVMKMQKQAHRTQKIVQNLLSFSRQHKPQRVHADLRNVMEDTIALRDFELKSHDIVVERHFETSLPFVVADPHQLEQVYLNIINNAADAMLGGIRGGILRIGIFVDGRHVVTEFHDSGPGIADPKRVFDPFYTTKGVGKGTGLGLSICYGIIKEHGGEISAENHPQGGALIRIKLPAAVGEKPMTEGERIVARREPKLVGRVLLVDAEQSVLDFEREVLSAAGLEVATLSSGEDTIALLSRESFDVIFLDSKIAGPMNSEEVFKWIQQSRPDLAPRTVLMLANSSDTDVRVFVYSSKILCLVKPFEVSDLLGVVRRVLRDIKPSPTLP